MSLRVWLTAGSLAFILPFGLTQLRGQGSNNAPEQPIPFSHKAHAGTLKLPCKMCHAGTGERMMIAAPGTCMQCHSAVNADSPAVQKLAAHFKANRDVPWVRVYRLPSFVKFSHAAHLKAGSNCQNCHGNVAGRDRLFREADLSMAGCMDCHREKNASLDCNFCHALEP
jgi:hypothetical protein